MSFLKQLREKSKTQISQESIQDVKTLEDVFKLAKVPYDKAFDVLKKGKYEGKYGTYLSEKEIVKYYTDISLNYETPKGVGQRFKSRWNAGVDKDSKDVVNGHSYKLYGNWARRIPIMGRSSGGDHPIVGLTFLDFDPTYPKFKGQLIKVDSPTKVITRFDRTVNAKEEMSNQHGIIVLNEVIKDLKGELKTSTESRSINPKTIIALILKIIAKKIYKKYLQNPVREKYYGLMKYQNCNEKSLDNTMSKLKGINDTAIVDGFEVKEVPGKTFTNSFIVNDKQLKTEEDIYKAVDLVVKEVGTLSDIITVIHKNAKSIKLSKDIGEEQAVNEAFGLIEKHIPKNIFQQFLPTAQPEDLVKVGGCNNHGRIKSKLINAIRPELLGAYKDLKDFLDDSEVDKNIRDGVGKELSKILDRYFTFIADVVEWMYRSMRRQTKKSGIATESYIYYYSLEDAEKEEAEYDAENAVAEDPEADTSEEAEEDVPEEDTETDSETTESDDEETEGTSDKGSEDDSEETKERREETRVELDNPDEEKQTIKNYLVPLAGNTVEELTLYTANEVNRPLYHVSMNPSIKAFYPKVSKRTLSKEDRSIPRISTSTSLIGCLNGYQSMVSDMEGRETKNFSGLFKVYDLPYQYAVKPSTKVVADVGNSDEYWLVSWKRETYATVPTVAADFTIPKIETVYGKDGKDQTYHCYIRVYTNLYLDHEKQLNQGYYHVVLNGYNFKYPLSNNKLISIHEISETEYNKVVALSMMVKHR